MIFNYKYASAWIKMTKRADCGLTDNVRGHTGHGIVLNVLKNYFFKRIH